MSRSGGKTGEEQGHGSVASQTKSALHRHTPFPRLALWTTTLSPTSVNSFSGAVAGAASGIVTCPLDVIKTKLQAAGSFRNPGLAKAGPPVGQLYSGLVGTASIIIREDGIRGLYRGLGPMLLGYLPTWAVYMSVYDKSREHFYNSGYDEDESKKLLARVYASVCAGACSTITTNPIWVIKTRMMAQVSAHASKSSRTPWHYRNTADAARQMYAKEGIKAFYSGLGPALLGLTHVAIQFPLYEYLKSRFTGLEMGKSPTTSGSEFQNFVGISAATFFSKVCATTATYPHEVLRTRLQTQQRRTSPEDHANGVATNHHSQGLPDDGKRAIGNTDGVAYKRKYTGLVQAFRLIMKEEGWRAFYNGMGTNMIRAVPAAMTTMLTYESVKGLIGKLQEEGRELEKNGGKT
ncbi:mitochondrial carrier [Teratosphaeria nubilosa]|uniref:Mitochondrial carrier n=1 Tax=Teratosphaeria nubilosa TaxID=161662 RepID=A0A6G1L2D5_9PEZI|nr:mitochondrial carrier [Teratosphaeria nubilosa]